MSNILVVGGAGYIGSHVLLALKASGFETVTMDNLSAGHAQAVQHGELLVGDTGDRVFLDKLFGQHRIDCVMHFAAHIEVGESVQDPLKYFGNNTANTLNLLAAMRQHAVDKLIFSSTAAVYGEPDEIPILEDNQTLPTNPYGRSKLYVEQILQDCDAAHGLRYTALRYFNAAGADPGGEIGEDHSPETHLIPLTLQAGMTGRPFKIFGTDWPTPDGTCLRDYIHVNDLAHAHVLALKRLLDGGSSAVYNLGCQRTYSVREVLQACRKVSGLNIQHRESERRAGDPAILAASSEKARAELDWRPRFEDLDEIVTTAWKWHQSHPKGYGDTI
jgi:UDP-glucose 4-epimerase